MIRELRADLIGSLGVRVRILPPMPVPEGCYESGRGQFISTKVLREMMREVPEDTGKMLGLIDRDLWADGGAAWRN